MGEILPKEWPGIHDDELYLVEMDGYHDNTPATDCSQIYKGKQRCCRLGWVVKAFINGDVECTDGIELCLFIGFPTAQILVGVWGPYDDLISCTNDL